MNKLTRTPSDARPSGGSEEATPATALRCWRCWGAGWRWGLPWRGDWRAGGGESCLACFVAVPNLFPTASGSWFGRVGCVGGGSVLVEKDGGSRKKEG